MLMESIKIFKLTPLGEIKTNGTWITAQDTPEMGDSLIMFTYAVASHKIFVIIKIF